MLQVTLEALFLNPLIASKSGKLLSHDNLNNLLITTISYTAHNHHQDKLPRQSLPLRVSDNTEGRYSDPTLFFTRTQSDISCLI